MSNYVDLAIAELKKNCKFKLGGVHNMKLKKKRATVARKGVNPFRKEPCVFKSKPASKTLSRNKPPYTGRSMQSIRLI